MSSIADDLLRAVLARLKGPQSIASVVKRTHRTVVNRASAPAVHLVEGSDTPKGDGSQCQYERELAFTVRVFVRDDEETGADALKLAVLARLDPESAAYAVYPHKARLKLGKITPDNEIADQDALAVDMDFVFCYRVAGWSLTTAA